LTTYAYARVSTKDQTLAAQRDALNAAGAEKLFSEKISGDGRHRPGLERLLKTLEPGDIVLVTRLDRLARSTRDLLNILETISKAGATFKSLADTWADTTTPHGRLIITVLGGLAAYERDLIKARTGEGRNRAKARGVHFGPKFKLTLHQRKEAKARHEAGETFVDIGKSMNVSYMTIARAVTRIESR
jgi:DNA invertase Pin-like site-specific DNA recombinase